MARPWLQRSLLSPTPVFTALASIFQVLLCPNPDLLLLSLLLLLQSTLPSTLSWGPGSENCLNLGPGNYPMRNGKFSSPGSHCSSKLRGGQRTRKGLTKGPHRHHSSHARASAVCWEGLERSLPRCYPGLQISRRCSSHRLALSGEFWIPGPHVPHVYSPELPTGC